MDDAVKKYRMRRQKRLDAKESGRWVTTEKKHKVHISEKGVPDKGNPRVLAKMNGGGKRATDKEFYSYLYKWEKGKEVNEENLKERRDKINKAVLERCPDLKSCKSSRDVSEYLMAKEYYRVDPLYDEGYGRKRYDTAYKCSLGELDLKDAKKVGEIVEEFFEKYPGLKGKFYGIYSTSLGPKTGGASEHAKGAVGINSDLFKDKELASKMERDRKIGLHPPTSDYIKQTIMHEYGHVIEGLLTKDTTGDGYGEFATECLEKSLKKFGLTRKDIEKEVGKYAAKSDIEFLAECFAENMELKKPRRVAKYVGELINEELKKKGYR